MISKHSVVVFACAAALAAAPRSVAQLMGARPAAVAPIELPALDPATVAEFIRVDGTAEIRVPATSIRVVLAVTSRGESAQACEAANAARRDAFLGALAAEGFDAGAVHVDFISTLPVYEWLLEDRSGQRVAAEKRTGFIMQTNVHIDAPDEARARLAVTIAYRHDVEDVIAFDYWCDDLESHKAAARRKAMAAAREKAEFLLEAFGDRPRLLNVQERTEAVLPRAMYRSFESAYAQGIQAPYDSQTLRIAAFRPKNFYYEGFARDVDVRDSRLPMRAEISVVSTVRLYFESPGRSDLHSRKSE